MAKKIDVLLLEDIAGLGVAGDIVPVSEGYARNALFPEGKAAIADAASQASASEKRKQHSQAQAQQLAEHQALATKLEGTELTIVARVKDEGSELYGKITATALAKELKSQAGIEIKAKDIMLEEPIVATGSYEITISIADEVEAMLTVVVSAVDDPAVV